VCGLLNIYKENVTIYPLDGQHKLMGVQGLMELIKSGKLQHYKKDKTADESFITLSDLIDKFEVEREQHDFVRWGKTCAITKPKTGIDKNHLPYN
jgi:hypothetical protein